MNISGVSGKVVAEASGKCALHGRVLVEKDFGSDDIDLATFAQSGAIVLNEFFECPGTDDEWIDLGLDRDQANYSLWQERNDQCYASWEFAVSAPVPQA